MSNQRTKNNHKNISRLFQHFPSFSRNQDQDGNNTPASDERAGRNFHLPNICTSILFPVITNFSKSFFLSAIALYHFHRFFPPSTLLFALIHLC